jgi:hypothetical protein
MSYYKTINKIRYAADLLKAADALIALASDQQINLTGAQQIYQSAMDGGKVTDIERRTLAYILDHYAFSAEAATWLGGQLGAGTNILEQTIVRVLRMEYNLNQIKWQIDPETVKVQEQLDKNRLFGQALKGAVEAFLNWNQGTLSLAGCVGRHDLAYADQQNSAKVLKSYFDKGTLFLIPSDAGAQASLGFELPGGLDFETFWIFGFQTPYFEPVQFIAFVGRHGNFQHSKGYFSKKTGLDDLSNTIIKQYADFTHLDWQIDAAEVEKQQAMVPNQNFGNALFAAVIQGIFNAESSFSFHDFIKQEVWIDPDLGAEPYLRAYVDAGKMYLIPQDYRGQSDAGTAEFPIPSNISLSMDYEWVFGIEMPSKTNFKILVTATRENNDGDAASNSCFVDDTRPLSEIIQRIVNDEFGLNSLEWSLPEEDALAQQTQFGPDWRSIPSLFRQALNTVLHDYISPKSVFNLVAKKFEDDIPAFNFDEPTAYRAAITHQLKPYLETAYLEFLPIEMGDNNPINGEKIEDNWLFFIHIPELHQVGFWVVIPRWPDDAQQAFVYGDY